MENLWPVDLLSELSPSDSGWDLLEAQAVAISQATKGLVQGELRRRTTTIGRSSALCLFPTDQPMKGYEFMAIRSPGESFPLALEVFHLGESRRIWQIRDSIELKRVLRKIFTDEATSRIVRTLAREAPGAQSVQIDDARAGTTEAGQGPHCAMPKTTHRDPLRWEDLSSRTERALRRLPCSALRAL